MTAPNYTIPINTRNLAEGKPIEHCDINQSIKRHLELIIMTRFGEHRSDPSFGCEIWDLDFELIISEDLWAEKLRNSMLRSISKHETRLSHIKVDVSTRDIIRQNSYKSYTEIRKKVEIIIKAAIKQTGDQFDFTLDLYLSPLSVDR